MEKLYLVYGHDNQFYGENGIIDYEIVVDTKNTTMKSLYETAKEIALRVVEENSHRYSLISEYENDELGDIEYDDVLEDLIVYDVIDFNDFIDYNMALNLDKIGGFKTLESFCESDKDINDYNSLMPYDEELFYCEGCDTYKPATEHTIYQDYDYCKECIELEL